ncbi:MAG: ABC transporter substrate-binding protein, partial [Clostridiales bacterium]|nr:ABC transporter substrate-binding protein [Clostridiales bacterium]
KYSDGSDITAKDYVFNFLLMTSPQIAELAGMSAARDYVDGFAAYQSGDSEVFSGIRLLSDLSFSVKVTADNLPYYFELNYINVSPLPYAVLVPGSDIKDDGEGVYVDGDFTAETLRNTLLGDGGYLTYPSVTSGPYRLVKYDAAAHEAEFEINPYYLGNYEGQIPTIQRILFREVKNENIIKELSEGTVDLVNKVTEGKVIDESVTLTEGGAYSAVPYPRTGSGFLAIAAEREMTSSVTLRQALAYMINYDTLPQEFLNGYGERVYGYYGLGQWMPQERLEQLEQMQDYTLDLGRAEELLIRDGWTYDETGKAYTAGAGKLRHKLFGEGFKPLELTMTVTDDNEAANKLAAILGDSLDQVGGKLTIRKLPFDRALREYYRQDSRAFDLMFLGSNFSYLFDPSNTYIVGDQYQGTMNTSGLQDPRLEELARNITAAQPGNREAYLNRWMEFQEYWSEVLPMIPLYSNTYYDLFDSNLVGYFPQFYWSWGTAILYASLNR